MNDSGWDKFKQLMKPAIDALKAVGKWVWDHIDGIALVLTVAAIALSWVPFVGAVLALAATAARGLAVLKSGIEMSRKVIDAGRKGDWGAVGRTLLLGGAELLLVKVGGKVITKALEKNSRVLATKVVKLGEKSVERFNSVRKDVIRVRCRICVMFHLWHPRPINPRWLQTGSGARAFAKKVDRFIQGESVRSIREHLFVACGFPYV